MLAMKKKVDDRTLIWLYNQKIYKAFIDRNNNIIKVYDENDNLLMKRMGIPNLQINEMERHIKFSSLIPQ